MKNLSYLFIQEYALPEWANSMQYHDRKVATRWWREEVIRWDGDTFTRLDVFGAVCTAVGTIIVFIIGTTL